MVSKGKDNFWNVLTSCQHSSNADNLLRHSAGGLAREATYFYKCLASLLALKWGDECLVVMCWLRCSLLFFLLRSAI